MSQAAPLQAPESGPVDGKRAARELWVADFGLRGYGEVLEIQRDLAVRRISGEIEQDLLLLVEHPPVVTMGRSAKAQHLLASPALLQARGVELFEVERGGDVTFHGPGQLVGYPIIDLKRHKRDLHWYLRQLEEVLIVALAAHDIRGERSSRNTGVWVGERKIASIGVHARDWVTWHGFALNVATDLVYFDMIVPCGIQQVTMTSMAMERSPDPVDPASVRAAIMDAFGAVFRMQPVATETSSLSPSGTVGGRDRPPGEI